MNEKKPWLVEITEERHKTVIVYTEDEESAAGLAESLCQNDGIRLSADYMLSRICEVSGDLAKPEDLHCYECYDEHGRVTTDMRTTDYTALEEAKQQIRDFLRSEYGETDGDPFEDLSNISLAYTAYEEGSEECNHPYTIDVKADLIHYEVRTYINDILVSTVAYASLQEMNADFLSCPEFDDLIYLTEEEWREYYYALLMQDNVNGRFPPNNEGINATIFKFHPGCRLQLDCMPNDPQPIPVGSKGTVKKVDSAGQIMMKWDNGRSLSLIPGVDKFHIIHDR